MNKRMKLVDAVNIHLPELEVHIDGKLIGYASMPGVGSVGGCEAVFDTVTDDELNRIEKKLTEMLEGYELDMSGNIRHWNAD